MVYTRYLLKDVCSRLSSGKNIKAAEVNDYGRYPVYGGNGLRGYTNTSNFKGSCAIIGRQGAYCGNVRFFNGEAHMTEHAVVVQGNELADNYYLSCLLSTMHLERLSGQSAQPGLAVGTLAVQEICLPSIEDQRRIASILSSLDRKIELNNKINAQLEEMAQALFKSWFVDFEPFKDGKFVESELGMIPEGWRVGKLEEAIEIKYGKDHKKLLDGNIPVYGSGGLMRRVNSILYQGESVLIPRKGTLNNIMYVNEEFWTVDTMFFSIPKIEKVMKYIYLFLKRFDFEKMNEGTSIPSTTTARLNSLDILIPSIDVLDKFDKILSSLYKTKNRLQTESLHLANLRDTLLPKLMNGEIEI